MPEENREEEFEKIAEALSESPYYKHLGMKIVKIRDKSSEAHLVLGAEHKNIWNTIHGGAVASLLDSTCGSSLYSMLDTDEGAITVDLRVNYLAPPREGLMIGKGKFVHRTRNLAWSEAEAYDNDGKLVARAQAIHRIIKRDWGK